MSPQVMPTTTPPTTATATPLRTLSAHVPQCVVAVCALTDAEGPRALVASTFVPISLDPPLVSVSIQRTSATWPMLRHCPSLGVSLFSEEQGPESRALSSGAPESRFAGIDWWATDDGAVCLDGAVATLECDVFEELPAGDHHIVVLHVRSAAIAPDPKRPLVFHDRGFRRLVDHPTD